MTLTFSFTKRMQNPIPTRRKTTVCAILFFASILLVSLFGIIHHHAAIKQSRHATAVATTIDTNNSHKTIKNFRRKLLIERISGIPKFPKSFILEPIVDVPLPYASCFLACVRPTLDNTDLTCHFREHFRKYIIGKVILDGTTFQIKSPIVRNAVMNNAKQKDIYSNTLKSLTQGVVYGEDPRSFTLHGEIYVMNNFAKHNTLMLIGENGAVAQIELPQFLGKKNITPIPLQDTGIMFIDFQEEMIHVCAMKEKDMSDFQCEPFWKPVNWVYKEREGVNVSEWYHRGGTAGVEVNKGIFVGFGHTTHKEVGPHHDIWYWKLDIRNQQAFVHIDHVYIDHRSDFPITDPTSLVFVGPYWYLFTAESNDFWNNEKTVLVNRVYRVKRIPEPSTELD